MTNPSESLKVAMAIVVGQEGYILEKRHGDSANGAVGKIGCFGGRIDDGEEPLDAVWREVTQEETIGLEDIRKEEFRHLGAVSVESDRDGQPAKIKAEVFQLFIPPNLEVTGKGKREAVRLDLGKIVFHKIKNELTPATAAAFERFYRL